MAFEISDSALMARSRDNWGVPVHTEDFRYLDEKVQSVADHKHGFRPHFSISMAVALAREQSSAQSRARH